MTSGCLAHFVHPFVTTYRILHNHCFRQFGLAEQKGHGYQRLPYRIVQVSMEKSLQYNHFVGNDCTVLFPDRALNSL